MAFAARWRGCDAASSGNRERRERAAERGILGAAAPAACRLPRAEGPHSAASDYPLGAESATNRLEIFAREPCRSGRQPGKQRASRVCASMRVRAAAR